MFLGHLESRERKIEVGFQIRDLFLSDMCNLQHCLARGCTRIENAYMYKKSIIY